jgi:hypothetical protein
MHHTPAAPKRGRSEDYEMEKKRPALAGLSAGLYPVLCIFEYEYASPPSPLMGLSEALTKFQTAIIALFQNIE